MINNMQNSDNEKWDLVVKPSSSVFDINLKEIWQYRDLLFLFVKRDIVSVYKQTILGPIWFILQPVLTSITFTFVFGNMANLSTDGKPKFLFYLAGITCWNYFADCLNNTSNTFINNAGIFGKVYFPRLVSPISVVISSVLKFCIQFLLFITFYIYYYNNSSNSLELSWLIIIIPFLIILMGLQGLALGIIISSFTTKYRDLRFLIAFGVQLLMYLTPVILPLSSFQGIFQKVVLLNPMTGVIETFKHAFFSSSNYDITIMVYPTVFTVVFLVLSIVIFNKVEKTFMDTV